MKRLILMFGLLLGANGLRAAAVPTVAGEDAYQFETVTVTTSTAKRLTTSKYVARGGFGGSHGGTQSLFCSVETDSIRFQVDGSSPTYTVGHTVASGDSFQVDGYQACANLIMFGSGTASASVRCTFFVGE